MFSERFMNLCRIVKFFIETDAIILYNVIVTANSDDSRGCWT